MTAFEFERGRFNVHYLTCPYALLVEALGDDGLTAPRDEDKVSFQWELPEAEVYDYRTPFGFGPEAIAVWHVQGSEAGLQGLFDLLNAAGGAG